MSEKRQVLWFKMITINEPTDLDSIGTDGMFIESIVLANSEIAALKREVAVEHEQVCQFIRDMYTGRFAEREKYYWKLPQWIRDAIEADPIYNVPSGGANDEQTTKR